MSLDQPSPETAAEDQSLDLRDELASAFDGPETAADGVGTTAESSPETAAVEQIQSLQAPKHWAQADRDLFSKAPPDIQKRWLDREGEYQKGFDSKAQEYAAYKREWDPVDQAIKPFERDLGLRGISRQQFVGQLVNVHKWLTENPTEALPWIAQQYEVDLQSLLNSSEGAAQVDPTVRALQSEIAQLKSHLTGFTAEQQRAAHATNLSKVSTFADAKDDKGNPLHPYFDELAQDIVQIMKTGEKDLDTAYKKACRLNEGVWEKIQAQQLIEQRAKQDQTAKARVEKAKKAAVGTDGQVSGATKPKSLREDLADAFGGLST
jgi:hypothetical protein